MILTCEKFLSSRNIFSLQTAEQLLKIECNKGTWKRGTPIAFNPDLSHTSLSKMFLLKLFAVTFIIFVFLSRVVPNLSRIIFSKPKARKNRNKSNEIIHADLGGIRGGDVYVVERDD